MKQKVISLIIIFMVCFSSCTSDRIVQEEITSLPSKSQNPSSRKPAPSTPSPEKETPFSPAPATGTEDIYHGSDLLKGYKTVSYTHLDVYKRQIIKECFRMI